MNYPSAADLARLIYRKQREGIKIDWRSLRLHDKKGGNASTNSLALRAALSATKTHEAHRGRKILDTNRHQNSPVSLSPAETPQIPCRNPSEYTTTAYTLPKERIGRCLLSRTYPRTHPATNLSAGAGQSPEGKIRRQRIRRQRIRRRSTAGTQAGAEPAKAAPARSYACSQSKPESGPR